jgi:predicted GIY-YIG superfamily endonuclease
MTKEYVIYALLDPRTDAVRYIGLTMDAKGREYDHKTKSGAGHYGAWKRSLLKLGLTPEMIILEENLTREEAGERERFWIAYGKEYGWQLVNLTDGGDIGCPGYKHTPEARARIAKAKRGSGGWHHTPEAKAKISEASRRTPRNREWRERISKAQTNKPKPHKGQPRSEECKAKLSKAHLGKKHTEEAKRKIGEASKGRRCSEETKAKMRAAALKWRAERRSAKND